jgi:uncharacterized protein YlxW (UPF0749 family)
MTERKDPDTPRPGDAAGTEPRPAAASSDVSRTEGTAPGLPEADRPQPPEASADVPPPLEMPTAGRRPESVTGPIGRPIPRTAAPRGDDPTVATTFRPANSAAVASGPGSPAKPAGAPGYSDLPDEETRPLSRPVAEETRLLRRPPDDGETRALRPRSAPGTTQSAEGVTSPGAGALPDGDAVRSPADVRPSTADVRPSAADATASGAGLSAAETLHLDGEPTVATGRPGGDQDQTGEADGPTERFSSRGGEWFGDGADGPGASASGARSSDGADRLLEGVPGVRGVDGPEGEDARVPEEDGEKPTASGGEGGGKPPGRKKVTSAGALIWVLLLLLGYTLVVQLRSNNDDQGLATARQEDLVSILSDLESRDSRLQTEIQSLESSQRQLTSGVSSRQAALTEAEKRADELGLLAGTLPGKGPGLKITIDKVKASEILNAVQELRGSGGEVMELAGVGGTTVRIVASSYFVDAQGGGIDADGTRLNGPWTLWVIGSPQTMQTALQIPGGVVASINGAGGSVTMEAQTMVEVTAVRKAGSLQYAKPTS